MPAGSRQSASTLLHDLLPKAGRVAGLMNLSNPSRQAEWRAVEAALTASGIAAQVLDAREAADIAPAFDAATRSAADGLVVGSDTVMQANQAQVVALAARHRLPAIYTFRDFVDAGGLMSYGVQPARPLSPRRRLCRPYPQWREARRAADRAADRVRACDQPSRRRGDRRDGAAGPARARRRDRPLTAHERRPLARPPAC